MTFHKFMLPLPSELKNWVQVGTEIIRGSIWFSYLGGFKGMWSEP